MRYEQVYQALTSPMANVPRRTALEAMRSPTAPGVFLHMLGELRFDGEKTVDEENMQRWQRRHSGVNSHVSNAIFTAHHIYQNMYNKDSRQGQMLSCRVGKEIFAYFRDHGFANAHENIKMAIIYNKTEEFHVDLFDHYEKQYGGVIDDSEYRNKVIKTFLQLRHLSDISDEHRTSPSKTPDAWVRYLDFGYEGFEEQLQELRESH